MPYKIARWHTYHEKEKPGDGSNNEGGAYVKMVA
jgi:hypothetical protein